MPTKPKYLVLRALDPELRRRLRAFSVLRGMAIKDVVEEAITSYIDAPVQEPKATFPDVPIRPPVVSSLRSEARKRIRGFVNALMGVPPWQNRPKGTPGP
jgi:hypothetical protein